MKTRQKPHFFNSRMCGEAVPLAVAAMHSPHLDIRLRRRKREARKREGRRRGKKKLSVHSPTSDPKHARRAEASATTHGVRRQMSLIRLGTCVQAPVFLCVSLACSLEPADFFSSSSYCVHLGGALPDRALRGRA